MPYLASPSPLTAHRSPLTSHLSPSPPPLPLPLPLPLPNHQVPYLTGEAAASPRTSIFLDRNAAVLQLGDAKWKIITGEEQAACWSGPVYPNSSSTPGRQGSCQSRESCGDGCLYNLDHDPTEHHDVAADNHQKLQDMQELLATLGSGLVSGL